MKEASRWRYEEVYQGSTYIGLVLDGERVVCSIEHLGSRRTDENVERSRKELRQIVELRMERQDELACSLAAFHRGLTELYRKETE